MPSGPVVVFAPSDDCSTLATSSRLPTCRYPLVGKEADNDDVREVRRPDRRTRERRVSAEDLRFWRALKSERRVSQRRRASRPSIVGDTRVSTLSPVASAHPSVRRELLSTRGGSSADEAVRRQRLKSMLDAAQLRHERGSARRAERPRFSAGIRLLVVHGELTGQRGTLIDADYIHARGQITLDGSDDAIWIGFSDLRSIPDE